MKLDITFDDKYYKSDAIEHGRVVRKFVKKLTQTVFQKSYRSYKAQIEFNVGPELLLLNNERNLYSIFAAAIDEITPVHLSEWSLNKTDTSADKSRRVDFWCLNKSGENGKALNYFIELKKNYYCVSTGTLEELCSAATKAVEDVNEQIVGIKKMNLNWGGDGDVYLGMIATHGYRSNKKNSEYDAFTVRDNIYDVLDKRSNAQLFFSTWTLPRDMQIQWGSETCDFVAISTVVITKQRNN